MNFCSQEMSGKKEKTLPEAVTLKGQLTKCAGAESTASQGSHFSNLLWKHYIRLLLCWEFSRQGSLFFLQLVESQGQGKHSTSQFYLLSLFRAAPREDKSTTLWVVFVEEKWHQNLEAACLTFHRKRHCDLFMFCGMCRSRSYQRPCNGIGERKKENQSEGSISSMWFNSGNVAVKIISLYQDKRGTSREHLWGQIWRKSLWWMTVRSRDTCGKPALNSRRRK